MASPGDGGQAAKASECWRGTQAEEPGPRRLGQPAPPATSERGDAAPTPWPVNGQPRGQAARGKEGAALAEPAVASRVPAAWPDGLGARSVKTRQSHARYPRARASHGGALCGVRDPRTASPHTASHQASVSMPRAAKLQAGTPRAPAATRGRGVWGCTHGEGVLPAALRDPVTVAVLGTVTAEGTSLLFANVAQESQNLFFSFSQTGV